MVKGKEGHTYRDEMIERLLVVFPQMSVDYINQLTPDEFDGLLDMARLQNWQPKLPPGQSPPAQTAPAPSALTPAPQEGTGEGGWRRFVPEAAEGVVDAATATIPTALGPAIDAAVGAPVTRDQGESAPAQLPPDPRTVGSSGEVGPLVQEAVLDTYREDVPQNQISTAIYLNESTITRLEGTVPRTAEEQRDLSEQLEMARQESAELAALNYWLYGVEPEQESSWYDPAVGMLTTAAGFLGMADEPRQYMRYVAGTLLHMATRPTPFGNMLKGIPWIGLTINTYGPEAIDQTSATGGPVAVWEDHVADLPNELGMNEVESLAWHALTDASIDPLSYTGGAAALTKGTPVAGRALGLLDRVANLPGDLLIGGVRRGTGQAGRLPIVRSALDLTEQARGQRDVLEPIKDTGSQFRAAGLVDDAGLITTPTGGLVAKGIPSQQSPVQTAVRTADAEKQAWTQRIRDEMSGVVSDTRRRSEEAVTLARDTVDARRAAAEQDQLSFGDQALQTLTRPEGMTAQQFTAMKNEIRVLIRQGQDFDTAFDTAYRNATSGVPARPAAPRATKDDPFGDFLTQDAGVPPRVDTTPVQPRPRHGDGTGFSDEEFDEFAARTGAGEDVDTVIGDINRRKTIADAEARTPPLVRPVTKPIPEPGPTAPTSAISPVEETPYIATKAERDAALQAGEVTVLKPMFANRRVIDRITARLAVLPSDVASRVRTAIGESNVRYNQIGDELEGTKYPSNRFFQKVGDQSLAAQEGSIRQVEIFREITGETPPPGETVLRKGVDFTNENRGIASIVERIIYGNDKQAREATDAFNRLWKPRDTAWGDSFLERAQQLRGRWAATLDASAPPVRQADDVVPSIRNDLMSLPDDALRREWGVSQSKMYTAHSDYDPSIGKIIRHAGKTTGFGETTYAQAVAAAQRHADIADEAFRRGLVTEQDRNISHGLLNNLKKQKPVPKTKGPSDVGFADTRLVDWVDSAGKQPDKLTSVADDSDAWIQPHLNRTDKLARLAKMGHLDEERFAMFDKVIPVAPVKDASVIRTGKQAYTADQKKIIKQLEKEGRTEIKRWDLFERLLGINEGNMDRTIRDFAAISGMNPNELKAGLKQFVDFWNGAKSAIRHAWMYNTPRLGYNLVQDTMTDTFTKLVDGQVDDAILSYRGFQDALQASMAGSRYPAIRKLGDALNRQFPQDAVADIERGHQLLGLSQGENVVGAYGGRVDEFTKELIENKKTWWTRKFGRAGSVFAPDFAMNVRTMFDDIKRISSKWDFMQRNIGSSKEEFYTYVRQYAEGSGLDGEDIIRRLEAAGGDYHGTQLFDPDVVRRVVGGGKGEHLARRWRSQLTALDKDARKHMERYLFSYRQMNADKIIGQTFLFHYWMTRASVLHIRLALDHPALLATYTRAWEGMDKLENENLPKWAQDYLQLMSGPYGITGLGSPAAALVGLGTVLDLNGLTGDESGLEQVLGLLPQHPIVMAAASVYLNDRTPDLTGTNQTRQFYRAAANYLNQQLGYPYEGVIPDYVAEGTNWLQGVARATLPGGEPMSGPSPSERDTQLVQFYAGQIMQEQDILLDENGSPTDEANQVMANIDAGLFSGDIEQEALDRFTTDMLAGRLMTMVPFVQSVTPTVSSEFRNENTQGGQAERGEVVAMPGAGGPSFMDTSRPMTQSEQEADYVVGMADAGDPESTELLGVLGQYDALGDDNQRETWGSYWDVYYSSGALLRSQLGGDAMDFGHAVISYDEWDQMDEDAREQVLNGWLASINETDSFKGYRAIRDEFEAAHPEVSGFKTWQDQIRDSIEARGVAGTLDEMNRLSPSFAAWWQGQGDVAGPDIQMVLMTPAAYMASEGMKPTIWDSTATGGPSLDVGQVSAMDIMQPQETGGFGSSGPSFERMTAEQRIEALYEDIKDYSKKMEEWELNAMALTGGQSVSALNPLAQQVMMQQLPAQPRGSQILQVYIEWAQAQGQGANTSVEQFVEWYGTMEEQELTAA